MYEVICARMDAISAVFGLLRKDARVRKGHNPWGYAGGSSSSVGEVMDFEMEKGNGGWLVRASEETLLEEKEKEAGEGR